MMPTGIEPTTIYYKRFRMEIDLQNPLPGADLPPGYTWVPWNESLLEVHAEVKYQSFFEEIDALVFPSLGSRLGCSHLMQEIRRKPGFRPEATWLVAGPNGCCATVQGVGERNGIGAIQNLGVTAAHRGKGIGAALLIMALVGFRHTSLHRAFLEVTAQNTCAIRLYRRLGFRFRKTIYKAVDARASWESSLQASGTEWPAAAFQPVEDFGSYI